MQAQSITNDLYKALVESHKHFNRALFEGELPDTLIVLQRNKAILGHFVHQRWSDGTTEFKDEISLNPTYWRDGSLLTIFQTLAHEMCHQWQAHFGNASRNGYHNKEWAEKMESIGLMPSSTGKNSPGSKRTGQKMSDYPIKNGVFIDAAESLVKEGYMFDFLDRFSNHTPSVHQRSALRVTSNVRLMTPMLERFKNSETNICAEAHQTLTSKKRKVAYSCKDCGLKVWGKPRLKVQCGDCSTLLTTQ